MNWKHNYSHCLEFPDSEFSSTTLNTAITYDQVQHFQWNYYGQNDRDDTICPRNDFERILPTSQDASAIKNQITDFEPRAGTSIFMGMKWATALLDPSFRQHQLRPGRPQRC